MLVNFIIMTDLTVYNDSTSKMIRYFLLMAIGVIIIVLFSLFQHVASSPGGEYYYSTFIGRNFKLPAKISFIITAFLVGYFWKLNPRHAGLSLFFIFPFTSLVEAIVYKGSHNLIPFEFVMFFVYALPSIIAVYLGKFTFRQICQRNARKHSTN